MSYFINGDGDSGRCHRYIFSDIGTDITVDVNNSNNPGVEVFSNIGQECDTAMQAAVAHGVLLAITALSAEGMHVILDDPKFEHCIRCALDKVPALADALSNDSN